jgi:hypothetical protein
LTKRKVPKGAPDLFRFLREVGVKPENAEYFLARGEEGFRREVRRRWVWNGYTWVR